jgi:hypothetical protein
VTLQSFEVVPVTRRDVGGVADRVDRKPPNLEDGEVGLDGGRLVEQPLEDGGEAVVAGKLSQVERALVALWPILRISFRS